MKTVIYPKEIKLISKQIMPNKIKLASTVAALFLFALPWVDIQCSSKSVATQSGLQVINGSGSVSEEMKALGAEDSSPTNPLASDKSMGYAPLVGVALILVVAAVIFSCLSVFKSDARADKISLILPVIALGLLLIQLVIGFPAKNSILEAMSKETSESQYGDDEFANSMASAMMMNINVKTTPVFYLELFALGIPSLLLVNGLIDKRKKG